VKVKLNESVGDIADNFPPLPSFCPCKPCFYQDFNVDIPPSYRRYVKIGFFFWIGESISVMHSRVIIF